MLDKNTIVVGVDGSNESLEAVKWAAARASLTGQKICLVTAYTLPAYTASNVESSYPGVDDELIRRNAESDLERAVEVIADKNIEVTKVLEPGDPTTVLVEISKQVGLIVLGTRGMGGFADRLLGTTSASVPAHGYCPVVVVPRNPQRREFLPVKKIVVGVDGSSGGSSSLHRAFEEAKVWNADLTAVEAVPMGGTAGILAWLPAAVDRDAVLSEVREDLKVAVGKLSEEYNYPAQAHVMDGSPMAVLTEFSTAVEMVVVGTKGRGGFAGMIMGSTSQSVLAYAYCPILVVPNLSSGH